MNKLLNSLLLPSLLISNISLALPGDLEQDMITTCPARSESFLDQGLEICRGTNDEPAQISQRAAPRADLQPRSCGAS